MILMSEITRRRIRSINKLLKINRQEVVVVLRVDAEKGYIDLSKRRVTPDDVAKTMAKYTNSKSVHSIMRHVAEVTGEPFEELSKNITWPLYKKFLHAAQAFQLALTEPDKAFEGITMSDKVYLFFNCSLCINFRSKVLILKRAIASIIYKNIFFFFSTLPTPPSRCVKS